jgi:hypothetical protein
MVVRCRNGATEDEGLKMAATQSREQTEWASVIKEAKALRGP